MMLVVAFLHFAAISIVQAKEPGWHVGWGFESHGGFPLMPKSWQRWHMNQSAVGYFLGNASGMDSPAELLAESRLGVVGVGWQINNIPSHHTNVEAYELEEARRLKALRPDVKVMLTRETEVTTGFYNMSIEKMNDPNTQDFWTQCGGKPCKGSWDSPAGNTPKYFFNFSNPRLADWWVNEFVVGSAKSDLVDGIYFDCSCGAPPGDHLDQEKMQEDAQKAFDRALKLLAGMGKWASAWNSYDGRISAGGSCASQMRKWIVRGQDNKNTLQIQVGKTPKEQEIAAFLIARGPSAMMNFPTLGCYGAATEYGWNPLMDKDFGEPLEAAVESPTGVFTRRWSKASVSLDCGSWKADFGPLTPPSPPPVPPAPPPPSDIQKGVDLGGGDLGHGCPGRPGCEFVGKPLVLGSAAIYSDCHDQCAKTTNCNTWSFKPSACEDSGLVPTERQLALCWLKDRGSGGGSKNKCRTSGRMPSNVSFV